MLKADAETNTYEDEVATENIRLRKEIKMLK